MTHRHRKIHHAQNLSALAEQSESSPFAAGDEAVSFPKGTYAIIHRPRHLYRNKHNAVAGIQAEYPGCVVGRQRRNLKYWSFEVQLPPGTAPPQIEKPPPAIQDRDKLEPVFTAWCSSCAIPITIKEGDTHFPEHRVQNTSRAAANCKKSGMPLPIEKKK